MQRSGTNHVFGAVVAMADPAFRDQDPQVKIRAGRIAGYLGCIPQVKNDWIPWIFSRLQHSIFQGEDVQGLVVAISTALGNLGNVVDYEFVSSTFKRLHVELPKVRLTQNVLADQCMCVYRSQVRLRYIQLCRCFDS